LGSAAQRISSLIMMTLIETIKRFAKLRLKSKSRKSIMSPTLTNQIYEIAEQTAKKYSPSPIRKLKRNLLALLSKEIAFLNIQLPEGSYKNLQVELASRGIVVSKDELKEALILGENERILYEEGKQNIVTNGFWIYLVSTLISLIVSKYSHSNYGTSEALWLIPYLFISVFYVGNIQSIKSKRTINREACHSLKMFINSI
jgi:hypothetical protein